MSFVGELLMYLVSFKLYDVDHDGYLTKPELERVLLKLVKKKSCHHHQALNLDHSLVRFLKKTRRQKYKKW